MMDVRQNEADQPQSRWYAAAMESLVGVVQALSQARDVDAIREIVRDAARSLTGADGATFVLRDGDQCHYVDENAISPLWKGLRFPMEACVSGWAMLNARSAVIEDIYSDARIPADAYRPTFVKSMAMVPIRRSAPIGAIGNYWAVRRMPTDEEVAILQALADTTSVALENAQLYGELRQKVVTLEEQRARIHEQRDALEVFTHALAHDLKEPVRSIRSFAEIIEHGNVPAEKAHQYFKYIQNAGERMGRLIDTVFRYTQLDDPAAMAKQSCRLADLFDSTKANLDKLIRKKSATVSSDELPTVSANPGHLAQVLHHLVGNAVRHGGKGVSVSIRAQEQDDRWLFAVQDNGPGIAAEHIEAIFMPFKRLSRDEECAGLGLAICRRIVAGHGGDIWCESTPGQGSTFFFTLPKAGASEKSEPSTAADQDAATAEVPRLANVLLVDDLEDHLELTRLLVFEQVGLECNLKEAHDGTEALEILRNAVSGDDKIDLMLLDINMPTMDGFELLSCLRGDDVLNRVPVVMCSGSDYEKDQNRAQELGAIGCLVKPPSWDKLKPMLGQIDSLRLRPKPPRGDLLLRSA